VEDVRRSDLAPKTRRIYAELWDRNVLPRLGTIALRQLTPEVVASFRADLTLRESAIRPYARHSRFSRVFFDEPSSGVASTRTP
jgi:hypothetical protein